MEKIKKNLLGRTVVKKQDEPQKGGNTTRTFKSREVYSKKGDYIKGKYTEKSVRAIGDKKRITKWTDKTKGAVQGFEGKTLPAKKTSKTIAREGLNRTKKEKSTTDRTKIGKYGSATQTTTYKGFTNYSKGKKKKYNDTEVINYKNPDLR